MGGWFNIDSKFYRFCSYVGDFIILMVLWAIFSLPVITIGASTTAAYYVATDSFHQERVTFGKIF